MRSNLLVSSLIAVLGGTLVALLVACSGGSGENEGFRPPANSPTSASPAPVTTPSTAAQENALVREIPLDGNRLRPLIWKLPGSVEPEHEEALLAARRAVGVVAMAFTVERPARWLSALLSAEKVDPKAGFYRLIAKTESLPWEKREAGPVWFWVQAIREISPTSVEIALCDDTGWTTTVGNPLNERDEDAGGIETLTVSLLDNYPDGKRWKVTEHEILEPSDTKKYSAQCKAWTATHTTTGSWTRPPKVEPTDGSAP